MILQKMLLKTNNLKSTITDQGELNDLTRLRKEQIQGTQGDSKTVKITKTNIPTIIKADSAPVLPSSNVDAKALGISATIPEKIINDIPLPMPL